MPDDWRLLAPAQLAHIRHLAEHTSHSAQSLVPALLGHIYALELRIASLEAARDLTRKQRYSLAWAVLRHDDELGERDSPGGWIPREDFVHLLDGYQQLEEVVKRLMEDHKLASGRSCMCIYCQAFRVALKGSAA